MLKMTGIGGTLAIWLATSLTVQSIININKAYWRAKDKDIVMINYLMKQRKQTFATDTQMSIQYKMRWRLVYCTKNVLLPSTTE